MKGTRVVAGMVVASAVAFAASIGAQEGGAREHSMTGCLMRGVETPKKDMNGNASRDVAYRLTDVEGNGPKTVEIMAAPKSLPLLENHKVQITGTAVAGPDKSVHYMRVTMMKSIKNDCP